MFDTKHLNAAPDPTPGYVPAEMVAQRMLASPGVDLHELAAGTLIRLLTQNSEYRIVLLDPEAGRVQVEGGRYFRTPTEAVLNGSSCGGSMLRMGWIGVGLQVELDYPLQPDQFVTVVTSPVEGFWLER